MHRRALLTGLLALAATGCTRLTDTPKKMVDGKLVPVATWKSETRKNIVMQDFDYSCGAAAMATLLNYYFGDKVTEREILREIIAHLDKETFAERKEDGLSLLDLQQFAERRGYIARGVRLKPEILPKLKGPMLVYLEQPEFRHFAIFRGVHEDRIYLADPARGNVRQPVDRFVEEWPGIALVLGKEGFGTPQDHDLAVNIEGVFRPEIQVARRALYLTRAPASRF
jgi:predicted double-glycine peptidase